MAIKTLDSTPESTPSKLTFDAASGDRIQLPSEGFVADATITRDGDDLVLQAPNGEIAIVKDYYFVEEAPLLQSPNGTTLTPQLVESFSSSSSEYAAGNTSNDESPVGAAEEVKGGATVTRTDGTVEPITIGTPIYQGDVIQTEADGAVNIRFMDETSMAVSESARLSIDNYNYDAKTESGETDFSVLRGVFVFTSGLIGRDDPDDVHINTPVGSIGIRGTIIAGDINPTGESSITVLEGAIVVTNSQSETTLSKQFETVHLQGFDTPMQEMGVLPAADINARFESVSYVVPTLFSTIEDSVKEQSNPDAESSDPSLETKSEDATEQEVQQQDAEPVQTEPVGPEAEQPALLKNETRSDILDSQLLNSDEAGLTNTMGLDLKTTDTYSTTTQPVVTDTTMKLPSGGLPPIGQPGSYYGDFTPKFPIRWTNTTDSFNFTLSGTSVDSNDVGGTVLGTLTSNAAPADVTYTFAGTGTVESANGYLRIVGNTVILTTNGATAFTQSLDPIDLGTFGIRATHTDGRTVVHSYTPVTLDANPALNLDSNTAAGVSVIDDTGNYGIGSSITAMGDINDDGYADFGFTSDVAGQNHVHFLLGGASNLVSDDIISLLSGTRLIQQNFGSPTGLTTGSDTIIAGIGDFNGDRREDYAIGRSDATFGGYTTGGAAIISQFNPGNNVTFADGSPINFSGSGFGYSVAGAGDFNNDGYDDVLIGAPNTQYTGAATPEGRVYFVKGHAGMSDVTSLATNTTHTTLLSGPNDIMLGESLTGIGDINGDGYSDFAIGAPAGDSGDGQIFIYHGNNGGSTPTAQTPINGIVAGANLGIEMQAAGDLNADGYSDFMVGAEGNAFSLVYGSASAPLVRHMNFTGAPFNNYTLTGGGAAGDFNGDGYDDFTVALADADGTNIYVVYGKSGLVSITNMDFFKNPENAFKMSYSGADDLDDLEIKGVGDINGDGYDDLAIGVPDVNGANTGDGGVIIVHGRDTGPALQQLNASANGQSLVGTNGADFMISGGNTGLSFRSGAGDDTISIGTANDFRRIDGGLGYDTLQFNSASGQTFDFSHLDFEEITSIERLSMASNNQTLILTVDSIFNLLKGSDTGVLKIHQGDLVTGGVLNIDADSPTAASWQSETIDALNEMGVGATNPGSDLAGFTKFQIGGYSLYIDTDVTVNVV